MNLTLVCVKCLFRARASLIHCDTIQRISIWISPSIINNYTAQTYSHRGLVNIMYPLFTSLCYMVLSVHPV